MLLTTRFCSFYLWKDFASSHIYTSLITCSFTVCCSPPIQEVLFLLSCSNHNLRLCQASCISLYFLPLSSTTTAGLTADHENTHPVCLAKQVTVFPPTCCMNGEKGCASPSGSLLFHLEKTGFLAEDTKNKFKLLLQLPSITPFQKTIADICIRLCISQSHFSSSLYLILITILRGRHRKLKIFLKNKELVTQSVS